MRKEKHYIRIAIVSFLCIWLTCFVGCSYGRTEEKPQPNENQQAEAKTAKAIIIDDIMSEEEYDLLSFKIIDSFPKKQNTLLSFFPYDTYSEDIDKLLAIDIHGIPVLISEIEVNRNNPKNKESTVSYGYGEYSAPIKFYYAALEILTRTQNFAFSECSSSYAGNIRDDLLCIKSKISEIMSTNQTVHKKIEKLKDFGVFALPYVVEEIENGNTDYVSFFTAAGFHLSHQKFAELTNTFSAEYDPKVWKTAEYLFGAEDFDYKVWLSENEEDLDDLFKFLDAYCAEYEAKNK